MGLEISTYIDGLNEDWPTPEDFRREGDDHIRLVKGTLLRTFPNVAGEVSLSHTQLNSLLQYVGDVEGNLISTLNLFPTGGIILWSGAVGAVPEGWALCDGTNGTPNLRDKFVVGAGGAYAVAAAGGVVENTVSLGAHTHTVTVESHTLTTSQVPAHAHTGWKRNVFSRDQNASGVGLVAPGETQTSSALPEVEAEADTALNSTSTSQPITTTTGGGGSHAHAATAGSTTLATQVLENRPPYYALAYIMKTAPTLINPVTPPGA